LERAGRRRAVAAGLAGVSLAAVMLPGLIRIPAPDGRRLDVAIVQGNDHEQALPDPFQEDISIARNHAALERRLARDRPDLAVWPEDAVDVDPQLDARFNRIVTGAVRA